jgi:8-oxo-dGTP pyrophosphatase MutT (NUDIX family)
MGFEPQKLFIGLIDFFSILLPGALLTYFLKDEIGPRFLGDSYTKLADTEGLVVFLFSSYLLGHIIFLIGSLFLDDWYDAIRNATPEGQARRKAEGKKPVSTLNKWLAARFFKKDVDKPVDLAVKIKEHYLDPLNASSAINAFQWSKARLTLEYPESIATVQSFEASSKFFRSFVVVLCILIVWWLAKGQNVIALISVPILALAFWRYVEQRLKATNQAYWYMITLEGQKQSDQTLPNQVSEPSHAGGVVYRRIGGQIEYLLVQATNAPDEWVLPKGHIDPGETTRQTAPREVQEETGVSAQIICLLRDITIIVDVEPITIRFYLMEALQDGVSKEKRKHTWLPLDDALDKASHKETKYLLRFAEDKRIDLDGRNQ